MFRCPKCRARKEFKVRKTGYCYKVVSDPLKFKSDRSGTTLGKSSKDMNDIQYKHYTMSCSACGHKDKVSNFKEAFYNPIDLFDTDNLCDCGGEVWQDIEVKKTDIPDDMEFVGDQRSVSGQVITSMRCDSCKKTIGCRSIE